MSFEVNFPDDFLAELLDADFDKIAAEALQDSAPVMEKALKESCRRAVEHEGDSELVESIRAAKPKKSKNGAWILNVGPRGYSKTKVYYKTLKRGRHSYPVSNALKAIWKEYGIYGQQPPRPFITSAINSVRNDVLEKIQEAYNRRTGVN